MRIVTIGFTKKPARRFFGLLRESGVERVLDVQRASAAPLPSLHGRRVPPAPAVQPHSVRHHVILRPAWAEALAQGRRAGVPSERWA